MRDLREIDYYEIAVRFCDNSRDLEIETIEEPNFYSPFVQFRKKDGAMIALKESDISTVKCKPVYKESKS